MKHLHTLTIPALLLTYAAAVQAQPTIARVIEKDGKDAREVYKRKVAERVAKGYEELLGPEYLEAARDLQWALRMGPEHPDKVRAALNDAKRQIGTLRLSISEPGAHLFVDGDLVALWPILDGGELYVAPGQHKIRVTKEEFATYEAVIDVAVGEEREMSIALVHVGYELYRKILGIPTEVNMSVEAKMGVPADPPAWPGKLLLGSGVGLGISAAMIVTGVAMTTPESPNWRGVTIGGSIRWVEPDRDRRRRVRMGDASATPAARDYPAGHHEPADGRQRGGSLVAPPLKA